MAFDLIRGSARCVATLVHYGSGARRCPHPTRLRRPTFPLGEGSVNAVQTCNAVPSYDTWYYSKPSLGGKVAAKQTNEGHLPQALRCVLRQHRTMRYHRSNYLAKPDTISHLLPGA